MKYAAKHSAKHMESSKPVCRHLPSFVFIIFIFGFAIWFLINPKADYSSSEKKIFAEISDSNGKFCA